MEIRIAGRTLRQRGRPYIIAEIGQAHEGSFQKAWELMRVAKDAGVDAVKWQYHLADEERSDRYDYWKSIEFAPAVWSILREEHRAADLAFIVSCFSLKAVDLARELGPDAWKIPSAPPWPERLDACMNDGRPILISTGMNTWGEIDEMVKQAKGHHLALLQCTSKYPTPLAEVGLENITGLSAAYGFPAGLSDHSGTIWPSVAAMIQGAAVIEVHLCHSRIQDIPDAKSSLEPVELRQLCAAREAVMLLRVDVDKNDMASQLAATRAKYGRPEKVGKPDGGDRGRSGGAASQAHQPPDT